MEEKRKRTKLLLLTQLFSRETDEDHMVSLTDINTYLEKHGVKPVDRKTLYSDFEELKQFGYDIMSEVKSGKKLLLSGGATISATGIETFGRFSSGVKIHY